MASTYNLEAAAAPEAKRTRLLLYTHLQKYKSPTDFAAGRALSGFGLRGALCQDLNVRAARPQQELTRLFTGELYRRTVGGLANIAKLNTTSRQG